jgi:hypothetical protein
MHTKRFRTADAPKSRAHLRLLFGMVQIAGVGFSLALLIQSGVTALSLIAVICTCAVTSVSVALFGSWSKKNSRE